MLFIWGESAVDCQREKEIIGVSHIKNNTHNLVARLCRGFDIFRLKDTKKWRGEKFSRKENFKRFLTKKQESKNFFFDICSCYVTFNMYQKSNSLFLTILDFFYWKKKLFELWLWSMIEKVECDATTDVCHDTIRILHISKTVLKQSFNFFNDIFGVFS